MTGPRSKTSVGYLAKADHEKRRCGRCRFYRSMYGTCVQVEGKTTPEAWCRLFEAHDYKPGAS